MNHRITRRHVLRGAMGMTLALPFLESLSPRPVRAQSGAARTPKRFVVFLHHMGTVLRSWRPAGTETDFTLPTILAPLEEHKSRLLIVDGVSNNVRYMNTQSDGHLSPARTLLTCQPYSGTLDGAGNPLPDAEQPFDGHANGPSIDQVLASRVRDGAPFASVDLAVGTEWDPSRLFTGRVLYHGKDDPVTAIAHPSDAFDRVFGGLSVSEPDPADGNRHQLSILDAVKENFDHVRARLGPLDRARLDAHAEKVFELEARLQPAAAGGCSVPELALPSGYDHVTADNVTGPLMMDIATSALSCNQTNVATLHYGTGDGPWFPWITDPAPLIPPDKYERWHTMVHDGRDRPDLGGADEPGLIAGYRWYTEQFALLLDRLASVEDEDGPLIDSTLVLWISDFGDGYGHETNDLPVILAGATGGAMGRYLDLRGRNHSTNQLMTTILNAFGFDDRSFGYPGYGSDALPGVLT